MSNLLKSICCHAATVFVLPLYASYWLIRCCSTADAALEAHSQLISMVPGRLGNYLRNAFYRLTLAHCDREATICFGVLISRTETRIGRHAYVGPRCMLGWVTLEDDVLLGPAVQIASGPRIHTFDALDRPIRNQPSRPARVTIGRDSWIGAGTIVLADVAAQTVVGANSTVARPLPAQIVAVGSPARQVRQRS